MRWLTRKELVDVITQVVFTHLLEPFIRSIETEHGRKWDESLFTIRCRRLFLSKNLSLPV